MEWSFSTIKWLKDWIKWVIGRIVNMCMTSIMSDWKMQLLYMSEFFCICHSLLYSNYMTESRYRRSEVCSGGWWVFPWGAANKHPPSGRPAALHWQPPRWPVVRHLPNLGLAGCGVLSSSPGVWAAAPVSAAPVASFAVCLLSVSP